MASESKFNAALKAALMNQDKDELIRDVQNICGLSKACKKYLKQKYFRKPSYTVRMAEKEISRFEPSYSRWNADIDNLCSSVLSEITTKCHRLLEHESTGAELECVEIIIVMLNEFSQKNHWDGRADLESAYLWIEDCAELISDVLDQIKRKNIAVDSVLDEFEDAYQTAMACFRHWSEPDHENPFKAYRAMEQSDEDDDDDEEEESEEEDEEQKEQESEEDDNDDEDDTKSSNVENVIDGIDFAKHIGNKTLVQLRVVDLKKYCERYGLKKHGLKAEIVRRIYKHSKEN